MLADAGQQLMTLPGVVGVGQGERAGRPVIKVMVAELTPALRESLPDELEGYTVEVEETGEIRALD